jgi:hypothetical protein
MNEGHERVELYLYSPYGRYLYSLYGPYALYRASVPLQGCTLRPGSHVSHFLGRARLRWRTSPYHTHSYVCGNSHQFEFRHPERWMPLRSRRDLRWLRERTSSQRGRRQVGMRSIHLGFPNRKYDAYASSPEEMTDVWTGSKRFTPVYCASAASDIQIEFTIKKISSECLRYCRRKCQCRLQLKFDGTRWRTGGEMKGKLANGSQYPSHYLGTWCIQHYYQQ